MSLIQIKKKLNKDIENVLTKLGIEYEVFSDNIYSTCPVHENSDNPRAFSFSVEKGIWKCWTRDCQHEYKNDIFGLIQGALSLQAGKEVGFKDVMSWISSHFNIKTHNRELETVVIEDGDPLEDFHSIIKSFRVDNQRPEEQDISDRFETSVPSEYFWARGFNKKTLKYFNVGDCLLDGEMKERSVIPIHNDTGSKIVGYIGRSIKEYRIPKFLLYPKGFEKRHYLYNYHRAKECASRTSCIYLLEGQGDVWKMYEAGVNNAVSLFGKTLSEQQEEKLRKLAVTHIIVLMDNDQAGKEARIQIQRQLGRMYKLTFPKLNKKDVGDMSAKEIKEHILLTNKGTF